jgi:23S rRNA (guanine1835-N2)-methyltransferase
VVALRAGVRATQALGIAHVLCVRGGRGGEFGLWLAVLWLTVRASGARASEGAGGGIVGRCGHPDPMDILEVPQGQFDLRRYPQRDGNTLRAWDAADELVLGHLGEIGLVADARVLVVNDSFGALSVALADASPAVMSDSYLSHLGIAANLERNRREAGLVRLQSSLDDPSEPIDVLVVKVPKSLALLEDQLHRIRPQLHEGTVVLGAAMARHIHSSTLELFEQLIGPTTTSRATKKARLIFAKPDTALDVGANPFPTSYDHSGRRVVSHANVFSQGRLDVGTRYLLQHLPEDLDGADVVDVGCGSGVIGLTVARAHPGANIMMIDESFMAVASAQATMELAGFDEQATAVAGDGLTEVGDDSVDLVVSNPPFHEDHSIGDAVAWQMFNDAHRVLRVGGELRIVGNQHLGYHVKLRRIFGNCNTIASNPKFVVLSARR